MAGTVLIAGIERLSLPDVFVLQRGEHPVEEVATGRTLIARMLRDEARLLLLGPALADPGLADTIQRIRAAPVLRRVSILAILPEGKSDAAEALLRAGANAVLERPLDAARFDSWVTRLLSVPRRVEVRVPVEGHVVGTPRSGDGGHFSGLTRNLSSNGMLLASPIRLPTGEQSDIDIELSLAGGLPRFRALGRVVREAAEVAWPYLGYGVEFLFVPPESQEALARFLHRGAAQVTPGGAPGGAPGIHSTVKRDAWIYEILRPQASELGWQAEIRRAPRDVWRPGAAGPFYVVRGDSFEAALAEARAFIDRQGA